jgi:RNA polymerase sigma-54 factor
MSTKLQLRGTAQITITPVMHYFIQLLANNRLDFLETILNEVEANPMLEIEPEEESSPEVDKNEYEERLDRADASFITPYEDHGFYNRGQENVDKNKAIESMTPSRESLSEHLMKQAQASFANENELEIARQIIYNLDADGYLKLEIESIASMLNSIPREIERIRNTIKTFDPPGCASRTLQECLIAQLGEPPEDEKMKFLIERHLENLSRSRYDEITRDLGIGIKQLFLLVARLKRLNPKPAKSYEKDETEYAEVDLMLIKENNEYKLIYIEEGMPRIMLSKYYQEMLQKTTDKKTISYLKERYRDAQFFIESIELRKKTIIRIAEHLIKAQKDYLDFGDKWKKPLTMKNVADAVNLNESTISRAVNNKFIASEKGLISLKSFFSYGLKGDFGFTHSVETIKEKIRELITQEQPEHPLSDDDVSVKLANLGIRIARRTIRNYREEMKIASSFIRKKQNKIKGAKT